MTKKEYTYILKKVADQRSVSVEEVEYEIKYAIDQAFFSNDDEIREYWRTISATGEVPTPMEVLENLVEFMKSNEEDN